MRRVRRVRWSEIIDQVNILRIIQADKQAGNHLNSRVPHALNQARVIENMVDPVDAGPSTSRTATRASRGYKDFFV
jgi:hypothetical protein